MEQIINAEYRVVPERTLEVIAMEIRVIDTQLCQTIVKGAVEIGRRLKEAKGKIDHGQWERWCEINLNYSTSWAAKLMKIYEEYGSENSAYARVLSNQDTCPDLSISKALRLLRVPEEQVEQFVEEHDPSQLTVKELEEEIRKLKTEKAGLEEKESEHKKNMEQLEEQSRQMQKQLEEIKENGAADANLEEELRKKEDLLKEAERKAEEASQKIKLMKEKAKEEKEKHKGELEKAAQEAAAQAKKEAEDLQKEEMEKALNDAEEAVKRATEAEEKLANVNSDIKAEARAVAALNIKGELMQEAFAGVVEAIEQVEDDTKKEKLRAGVAKILDGMKERLTGNAD